MNRSKGQYDARKGKHNHNMMMGMLVHVNEHHRITKEVTIREIGTLTSATH